MSAIYQKIDKKVKQYSRIPKVVLKYHRDCDRPDDRYIFHHMPKCGGTSAVDALSNWFVILKDYPVGWSDEDNYPVYQQFCDRPRLLDSIKPYQLIVGHYHLDRSYLPQRYPNWEAKGYRLFTFLRDPLELQISLYHYEIRNRRIAADKPLEEQLLLRNNYMATCLPCNHNNYIDVLRQYFFIGIMEDYQRSFDLLSIILNKPAIKLKTYNSTSRKKYSLSPNFIEEFQTRNQLDYQIYHYGRQFLEHQLQKHNLYLSPEKERVLC